MTNTATLYRDAEYGALGLIPTAEGILTVDHGFAPGDFDVVLEVLERNAREDAQGNGVSLWRVVGHPLAVLGSVESALRRRGYVEDKLAERAILSIPAEVARTPDLPVEARAAGYRPHEAVERALRRYIETALSGLKAESVDVRWFPRPAAPDRHGRPLPFARVRAILTGSADVCRAKVLEGLAPVAGAVVRLSVTEGAATRVAVEFALSPSREVAEAFLDFDLPTFAPAKEGMREARFLLDAPLLDADRRTVEGRALACNAALRVEAVDARTVRAFVPAGFPGDHLFDHAFSERVGWLAKALAPWSAALESVSDTGLMVEAAPVTYAVNDLVRGARRSLPMHANTKVLDQAMWQMGKYDGAADSTYPARDIAATLRRWMTQNERLLDDYPDARRELEQALALLAKVPARESSGFAEGSQGYQRQQRVAAAKDKDGFPSKLIVLQAMARFHGSVEFDRGNALDVVFKTENAANAFVAGLKAAGVNPHALSRPAADPDPDYWLVHVILSSFGRRASTHTDDDDCEYCGQALRERVLTEWEDDPTRPITPSELKALEHFLDAIFRKAGLDIAFTRHFFDRVNDPRNREQITAHELFMVFSEVYKKFAAAIKAHGADWEALIKDVTTSINVPFILQYDRHTGLMSLVMKTVMRKDNFLTRDQKLVVATHDENESVVVEGVLDPHILKAIFLAGGGGSGKGFISNLLFGTMKDSAVTALGLKSVNSDDVLHSLAHGLGGRHTPFRLKTQLGSPAGQMARERAKEIIALRRANWLAGRLGIVLDGTGKDAGEVLHAKHELEALGYDTYMVFVDTSLEVSMARNLQRERVVPEPVLIKAHQQAQAVKAQYHAAFGDHYFPVDNSRVASEQEVTHELVPKFTRMAMKILNTPIHNPRGQAWVQQEVEGFPPEFQKALFGKVFGHSAAAAMAMGMAEAIAHPERGVTYEVTSGNAWLYGIGATSHVGPRGEHGWTGSVQLKRGALIEFEGYINSPGSDPAPMALFRLLDGARNIPDNSSAYGTVVGWLHPERAGLVVYDMSEARVDARR